MCVWFFSAVLQYEKRNAYSSLSQVTVFPMQACSQHCLVLGLNQLPFYVASLQLWLHLSCQCECYHLIMPGCIKWQLQLLLERILNPMSQATARIPLTMDSGERWTQFSHNLNIVVFASAKHSKHSATIPQGWHNPTSHCLDLRHTISYLTSVITKKNSGSFKL